MYTRIIMEQKKYRNIGQLTHRVLLSGLRFLFYEKDCAQPSRNQNQPSKLEFCPRRYHLYAFNPLGTTINASPA